MAKNLVIVESPAKAKTIEGFLGKDFIVKSSYGHIRDLPKKGLAINLKKNYEPEYEVSPDKQKIVSDLKKLSKESEIVWLATDEDREGEAISWHLFDALGLEEAKTKRIVFHEITKSAISKAIENPRSINYNLVDAQQARRVLDRIVGFELSPILWKKVKPSLSAGRVQSVTVRLIVEREREISNFKSSYSFRVVGHFPVKNAKGSGLLKAECSKRFASKEEATAFLNKCKVSTFSIKNLETKPAKKSPAPPFTTSTLQQEAGRKLGFSVAQTMTIAQRLYESGKITYMRTDSVNLSELAISTSASEINNFFGKEYLQTRKYTTKAKGAQEAHEAIRPTYMDQHSVEGDNGEKKLYDLIWKRTIASQMADAQLERTNITIGVSNSNELFIANGEVIKFDGFLKVYLESSDDENEEQEGMLPPVTIGEVLEMKEINATQKFTQHPPRYSEASLVKKLEELGIGRPSTYAPTISTVQKRGYVTKEDRVGIQRTFTLITLTNKGISEIEKTENYGSEKSKLFPTDIGMVVNDFLVEHFKEILDYNFTAEVEKEFDEVAEGQVKWTKMIDNFYKPFHSIVETTEQTSERAKGERLLGVDPKTQKNIYAKIGKFGPLVQLGENEDIDKPKFAGLKKGQRLENITLEEALDLFKLPRQLGSFDGKEVMVSLGRFGPFVKIGNEFASLKKEDDPFTIELSRAIELMVEKKKSDEEKIIKDFGDKEHTRILNGRWGAYIAIGKNNYKIPKGQEPKDLSLDDCRRIAEDSGTTVKKGKRK
ncbi:MAG: type I DNA topoisomerase [Bacteroidia bacterium]|nr:type I DNA topoisomerase [Bacteroidia bacterium]